MKTITKKQFQYFNEIFSKNVGVNLYEFLDKKFLSQNIIIFDIVKFNDFCIENLGYNEDNCSLSDFISKNYPKELSDVIVNLFEIYVLKNF